MCVCFNLTGSACVAAEESLPWSHTGAESPARTGRWVGCVSVLRNVFRSFPGEILASTFVGCEVEKSQWWEKARIE